MGLLQQKASLHFPPRLQDMRPEIACRLTLRERSLEIEVSPYSKTPLNMRKDTYTSFLVYLHRGRASFRHCAIAQSVERHTVNVDVPGSSPGRAANSLIISTLNVAHCVAFCLYLLL